jgi:chaperone required for assembly of F1-ATPase
MAEPTSGGSAAHPTEAARRLARPVLPRRFYAQADAAKDADACVVRLDGRAVRTPARRILAAPTLSLAQAIAAEWQAQRDVIDPATMPLTRLANAVIDGVADRPGPVADDIAKYAASDLLFYRAATPGALVERQRRHWDPVLAWAAEVLGARFAIAEGVIHVAQPQPALAAVRAAIPDEPWPLGALHAATTLMGSALLALALAHRRLPVEEAWQAAHVDEDWNMEQWGRDALALERRAMRFAEFNAAATVLDLQRAFR